MFFIYCTHYINRFKDFTKHIEFGIIGKPLLSGTLLYFFVEKETIKIGKKSR